MCKLSVAYYAATKVKARRRLAVNNSFFAVLASVFWRTGASEVVVSICTGSIVLTWTGSTSVQIYLTVPSSRIRMAQAGIVVISFLERLYV